MVLLLYAGHFSKYYWDVHEQDDKHNKLLKQRCGEEELIAEGKMKEKKKQAQLIGYSLSAEKNKKYPAMEDESLAFAAGGELSAVDKAVIRSIVGLQDNFACAGQSNSKLGSMMVFWSLHVLGHSTHLMERIRTTLLWYTIMFSLIKPNLNTSEACILPGQQSSQNNAQELV